MNRKLLTACLFGLLSLLVQNASAAVAVVVAASSAVDKLDKAQVAALFLGQAKSLPGGGSAQLLDLPSDSSVREAFYQKVSGRSASQIKATWARLIFSGVARPPKEVGDAAAVKKAVLASPNALGYVDSGDIDGSVKVVLSLP